MKFPREVWPSANKQTTAFANKRKLVHSQEEFRNFVKLYNGKMNCFTSVYDYETYSHKQAVVSTVILDRVFLDFDAHHGEEPWRVDGYYRGWRIANRSQPRYR